jgi:putative hydrolase of the HAD superfamily
MKSASKAKHGIIVAFLKEGNMIKAVFLDYTGTILQLRGNEFDELLNCFIENTTINDKDEAIAWYYDHLRVMERECYQDSFLSQEELAGKLMDLADTEIKLKADHAQLYTYLQNYWMYAPLFSDVQSFFDLVKLPIYILMDNAGDYAKVCLRRNGLHANAIISGEDVKAYKPRKEIFAKALALAGCQADEVIHVGDDLEGDVEGAKNAGITPILLDRRGEHMDAECRRIHSLPELLPILKRENEG